LGRKRAKFASRGPVNPVVESRDREFHPNRRLACLVVTAIGAIRILCDTDPSFATTVVNGLLAWIAVLGGLTAFCSGLPAAVALIIPSRPDSLDRRINRGLGFGFVVGVLLGALMFFVFIARVVS
jgi:hypothetical protein